MVARLLFFAEGSLPVQACAPDFSLTLSGHGFVMQ